MSEKSTFLDVGTTTLSKRVAPTAHRISQAARRGITIGELRAWGAA